MSSFVSKIKTCISQLWDITCSQTDTCWSIHQSESVFRIQDGRLTVHSCWVLLISQLLFDKELLSIFYFNAYSFAWSSKNTLILENMEAFVLNKLNERNVEDLTENFERKYSLFNYFTIIYIKILCYVISSVSAGQYSLVDEIGMMIF